MKPFKITKAANPIQTWLRRLAATTLLPTILLTTQLQAAEPADPSVKLREQLRAVTLQLRTAQTETANAQAAAAVSEAKATELTTKAATLEKRIETLTKDANTARVSNEQTITTLETKLADREKRLIDFQQALEKWKDGYQKAAAVANDKEQQRATLAAEIVTHKRTIADRERKNITLFNTATEILDRYENYALGKALAAREPFVSTTRVKVENQVQGYKDNILDNRIEAKKP